MPYVGTGLNFGGFTATIKDSFTGDGSATDFTLSRAPSNAFDIEVFVGNVRQNPNVAYTVSGTTLAFTGTPASGEVIYAVHQAGGGLTSVLPQSFLGVKDYTIGGNLNLNVDNSSALKFGADQDVTITHVADTGLSLKNTATADDKPFVLTLQTGETDIAASDKLGVINFQAPDEGTGTDAILVAAGIEAVSEGDFSSSSNATKLSFKTASSAAAAETMGLSSGGNLSLPTDTAVVSLGADADVTLTHVHNTGILLNSTNVIQFNDASQNIGAPSATVLDINATDEIELNATLVDVNANLDVSGTIVGGGAITGGGLLTTGGNIVIPDAGNIGSASDTNAIGISSGGVVSITATTANTSASDGALTVAGGLGVAADASVGDDLRLISDAAVLSFGADGDVTFTHVADTGLLLNGTSQLQFNDASQNITAPSATVLDINATDEIELNATLVDVNANLDVSGTITGGGLLTTGGNIVIPDAGNIGSASDTDSIAIASDGVVTLTQKLIGTELDISGNIDVDGTTNLDVVDIDGAVDMASTLQVDGAITSSAGATITTADNNSQLTLVSTDADATAGPRLDLKRDSGSPADSDTLGRIRFLFDNDAAEQTEGVRFNAILADASDGTEDVTLAFKHMIGGTLRDSIRFTGTEAVINEDGVDLDFRVESNGDANSFVVEGATKGIGMGTNDPTIDSALAGVSVPSGSRILHIHDTDGAYLKISDPASGSNRGGQFAQIGTTTIVNNCESGSMLFGTGNTLRMTIDANGHITMPTQSAFLVHPSTNQLNFAVGSQTQVVFGTERFDQNADFSSNTFTAPVTGKYQLSYSMYFNNVDSATNYYQSVLLTSNKAYYAIFSATSLDQDAAYWNTTQSLLVDMDANDTATLLLQVDGGTAQTDLTVDTYFSGVLVC